MELKNMLIIWRHLKMILVTILSSICLILFQTQINMNLNPTIEVNMNTVIKAMFIWSIWTKKQNSAGKGPYHALTKVAPPFKITNMTNCMEKKYIYIFLHWKSYLIFDLKVIFVINLKSFVNWLLFELLVSDWCSIWILS